MFGFLHPSPTIVFIVQGRRSQAYEPLLLENEREAVADLLQYLESMVLFCSFPLNGFAEVLVDRSHNDQFLYWIAPFCLNNAFVF